MNAFIPNNGIIMSKIAILGDTHFGMRNGSKAFSNYFDKFYTNIFFPYLEENNISVVIQTADLFDNRKHIHLQALDDSKRYFFSKFDEYNINLITYLGNHDVFHKNTLTVNSPNLLLNEYNNIKIYDQPSTINLFGSEILVLPWICTENYSSIMEELNKTKAHICFGHLELSGFAMYKGIIAEEGMDASIFNKFEYVFSGHYHTRSYRDNIYYCGTAYEMSWGDYNDQKGFHIFDLNTRQLQFIENPYKMFNRLSYDDTNEQDVKRIIDSGDLSRYEDVYVKLNVIEKQNPYLFDLYVEELYKYNPLSITIVEDNTAMLTDDVSEIDETQDTMTTLYQYLDSIKTKDIDMNKLKNVLSTLYHEAVNIQS